MKCPCCKADNPKDIELVTDWGYETFFECVICGIIFRDKS